MTSPVPEPEFTRAQILEQLERVCSSPLFKKTPTRQQLLRYLVVEAAWGRGDVLTRERVFEKFGRKELRLQDEESLSTYKKRIQQRLDLYYRSAGPADRIRISMRSDTFRPEFSLHGGIRPIVGRDGEITRFRRFYERRKDELCIVSIGGVSGIGKTTLSELILQQAMSIGGIEHVVSVHGPSDGRSGALYMPFRDAVLGIISEVGDTAGELRDKVAPSWRDTSKHGVASELGIFLQEVTKHRRMAVFIDNFHLSDHSSEALLSELARTRSRSRLILVVAFREFELKSLGHPYLGAERRLELDQKCLRLRPHNITATDVREYMLRRFPQNLFPPDLTRVVYEYCAGIPLHLVNLIDYLERDETILSNGHSALIRSPDQIAADLSALAEHSMALPLVSLADNHRYLLAVAALLGERFESGLLADIVQEDHTAVERELTFIYRTHRLIDLDEASNHESQYRSSVRYRFSHSSYRDAFLGTFETLPTERSQLANRAIDLLITYAPPDSPSHSARIAALMEYAGRTSESIQKYAESAQLSSSKFAHGTAALLARRAINLLKKLPENNVWRSSRIQLNILLGMAVMSTSGFAAPELEHIYNTVLGDTRELCDAPGERIGLYGMWVYSIDSGHIEESLDYASRSLTKAIEAGDVAAEVEAHYATGTSLIQLGRFEEAQNHFVSCLGKADSLGLRSHWFYQLDAAVSVRCQSGRALWFLGNSAEAIKAAEEAFTIARRKTHPESRAYALVFLADIAHLRRDAKSALELSAQAISASIDCGASQELAWAQMVHVWALAQRGEDENAVIAELEYSFAFYKKLNARVALTKFYGMAAEVYMIQGNSDEANRQLDLAESELADTKETYFESELKRLRAEALLAQGGGVHAAAAEASFRESYGIADRLKARSLQLRTALSLWRHRDNMSISGTEVHLLLDKACSKIPDNNDDSEVREARKILGRGTPENRGPASSS